MNLVGGSIIIEGFPFLSDTCYIACGRKEVWIEKGQSSYGFGTEKEEGTVFTDKRYFFGKWTVLVSTKKKGNKKTIAHSAAV
jgi:hypothetical protein